MKSLIYSFLVFLMFFCYSCENEQTDLEDDAPNKIGEVVDGKSIITTDTNVLKSKWSKFISDSSPLTVSISAIEIVENEQGAFLMGYDYKNKATSMLEISYKNGGFYGSYSTGCTVTCSGCTSTGPGSAGECEPAQTNGAKTYCTSCSQGTCTKTVSCGPIE